MKKYITALALMVMTSMSMAQTTTKTAPLPQPTPSQNPCVMFFPASGVYINLKEVAYINFDDPMNDLMLSMTNGNEFHIALQGMAPSAMGRIIAQNMRQCIR